MRECILRGSCEKADTCKSPCGAFIQVQGLDGNGGKQHDAGIPSEYKQTTLETARCREAQSNVYRNLEEYVKTFKKAFNVKRNDKENRLKDLFFYSKETGLGKTETACALANEFLHYSYIRSVMLEDPNSFSNPVYFMDMPRLMSLYLKANRGNTPRDIAEEASRDYYNELSKAKKCRIVVFDEMGLRDISEAFCGDIHEVINHRTVNNLTSILTSNISMDELENVYGRRIFDRVRQYCIQMDFLGESKRGKWMT